MEQIKHQQQNQEQLPFSEQLRQNIINQPYDLATLWGRAAISANNNASAGMGSQYHFKVYKK